MPASSVRTALVTSVAISRYSGYPSFRWSAIASSALSSRIRAAIRATVAMTRSCAPRRPWIVSRCSGVAPVSRRLKVA